MTGRLRIFMYISNYVQTLEIMEKTLSDENEPIITNFEVYTYTRMPLNAVLLRRGGVVEQGIAHGGGGGGVARGVTR